MVRLLNLQLNKQKDKISLTPKVTKTLKIITKKIYKIRYFFSFSNTLEFFLINKVLNYLMFCGQKDKAYKHWIQFQFQLFLKKKKIKNYVFCINPISLFILMLRRANILVNLKKKKVAGRTHHVPLFLDRRQQILFTLKNYIVTARLHVLNFGITAKLLVELLSILADTASNNFSESQLNKKKRWLYTQAIDNKFYIKFL